jgi:hypothetical protein
MSDELTLIKARLNAVEELVRSLDKLSTTDLAYDQTNSADFMALYSIVAEMAEQLGLSPEQFLEHFRGRFRWWHDHYLRRVEDVSPGHAAEIDARSIAESDVPRTYPPIFDRPPTSPS